MPNVLQRAHGNPKLIIWRANSAAPKKFRAIFTCKNNKAQTVTTDSASFPFGGNTDGKHSASPNSVGSFHYWISSRSLFPPGYATRYTNRVMFFKVANPPKALCPVYRLMNNRSFSRKKMILPLAFLESFTVE